MALVMINASFINAPLLQDQQMIDVRVPLPVDDAILMCNNLDQKRQMQADQANYKLFPT